MLNFLGFQFNLEILLQLEIKYVDFFESTKSIFFLNFFAIRLAIVFKLNCLPVPML